MGFHLSLSSDAVNRWLSLLCQRTELKSREVGPMSVDTQCTWNLMNRHMDSEISQHLHLTSLENTQSRFVGIPSWFLGQQGCVHFYNQRSYISSIKVCFQKLASDSLHKMVVVVVGDIGFLGRQGVLSLCFKLTEDLLAAGEESVL